MNVLRALVRKAGEGRGLEAKLVELEIAVAAPDFDALVKEVEHAICLEYQIAKENGQTPFAQAARGSSPHLDSRFSDAFQSHGATVRMLDIPDHICEALAIALRTPKPVKFAVEQFTAAAA